MWLGALNRVSRDVRDATLPVLYEKVNLSKKEAVESFPIEIECKYTK